MNKSMAVIVSILAATLATQSVRALELPPQNIQLDRNNSNMTKVLSAQYRAVYGAVSNKYLILRDYWYDTYDEGECPVENVRQAGGLLKLADAAMENGDKNSDSASFVYAGGLLTQADTLLNVRVKNFDQFPYDAPTPLKDQDASKVRKSTAADYAVLNRFGVLMNDIGPSIWGVGDDGEKYMIMTFFNYHATGAIVKPVLVELMSTIDPSKHYMYLLNAESKVTTSASTTEFSVIDGAKSFKMLVTDKPGESAVIHTEGKFPELKGKAPAVSFSIDIQPRNAYWYNQNRGAATMYPDIVLAGFEQAGPMQGTITMGDKRIAYKGGAVSEVCLISGAPGKSYREYRTAMTKYGNEWYIQIHSDQLDASFISYGKFRDAGVTYKGQYIIPLSYKITPDIASKSITLTAQTKEFGELKLHMQRALTDTVYTDGIADTYGTFDGQQLSNSGGWLEHVSKGAPDGIVAVQEYPQLVDPM